MLGNIQYNFALISVHTSMVPALLSQYPVRCLAQKCSPWIFVLSYFSREVEKGSAGQL